MDTKIAVVTGASYGLGNEVVKVLLGSKYHVYGVSRTNPTISSKNFSWIRADLTKDSELNSISSQIKESKVDLLINCAGRVIIQKTAEYTDLSFDQTFDLDLKSPIKLAIQLLPKLAGGVIINISSNSDRSPDPDFGLYGSSKAALNIFFETMATENPNVKIINLLPSYIDTPLLHKIYDHTDFDWSLCMSAKDVAEAMSDIVSNHDKFETGSRILILKKLYEDNIYNPEKLWVYTTNNQSTIKIY